MRFDIDSYSEILETITRNKVRSFLTGFGIFWGLFMLLFMMGVGDGVRGLLYKQLDGFATNTAIAVSNYTSLPYKGMKEGRYWSMEMKDVERLALMMPELDVVTPVVSVYDSKAYKGEYSAQGSVKGVLPEYGSIEAPKLKYGRYINRVDIDYKRKVCVIGKKIYRELFPDGGDPCGQFIKVGPVYYRIVGVDFNQGNVSINGRADRTITIPLTLAQQLYNRGDVIDLLCMTAKASVRISDVEASIRNIMARAHDFDESDKDALMIINTQQLFMLVENIFKGVNFLIWLIGLGTLLAGAIGVSNIMMVTVRERTTEIGIRRAIGATPRDILTQILSESMLLTLVSGMISIMFSVFFLSIASIIASQVAEPVSLQISFRMAMLSLLIITVMGLLSGLAPALRAMEIKPVDAMRNE